MSSKGGLEPIIQDITVKKSLPVKRRGLGDPTGCGKMFGATWHSAQRNGTCILFLDDFLAVTGVSKIDLLGLIRKALYKD